MQIIILSALPWYDRFYLSLLLGMCLLLILFMTEISGFGVALVCNLIYTMSQERMSSLV